MYLSAQVDKFFFRLIAVRVGDPASLLCVSKPIHSLLQADYYEHEWFSCWHSIYCPYRPWQYAAVTWRRLQGASAEQLVSWMLCYLTWATQQRERAGLGNSGRQQPEQLPDVPEQLPDVPVHATAAPGNGATPGRLRKHYSHEGRFAPFPACWPTPATVRDAKQLLRKGRAVDALVKLCPDPGALLMPYAAKAQNVCLVQEFLAAARTRATSRRGLALGFPVVWLRRSSIYTYFYTQLIVCYQALSAGNPELLQTLLMISSHWTFPDTHQKLLQHAARHSNAACIKALLAWDIPNKALVDTNHLAMAAYRTDPWAAEAVAALLEVLEAEQRLKASSMRAAYTAACSSGNWVVLQVLLEYAVAHPQQHLPALLEAAVVAGNLTVLLQLLCGPNNSSSSSSSRATIAPSSASDGISPADCQAAAADAPAAAAAAAGGQAAAAAGDGQTAAAAKGPQQTAHSEVIPNLPILDWSCLTSSHIKGLLQAALKGMSTTAEAKRWQSPFSSSTSDQLFYDGRQAAATAYVYERHQQQQQQVVMADAIWQHLVEGQGRTEEVVPYITSEDRRWLKLEVLVLELAANHCDFVSRLSWLQQHNLCAGEIHPYQSGTESWVAKQGLICQAADAGDFQHVLQLLQLAKQFGGSNLCDLQLHKSPHVLVNVLGGQLRRAAAAGNGAAVAQIDKLAALCCCLFAKEVVAVEAAGAGAVSAIAQGTTANAAAGASDCAAATAAATAAGAGAISTTAENTAEGTTANAADGAADGAAAGSAAAAAAPSIGSPADAAAHAAEPTPVAAGAAAAAAASPSSMLREVKQPWLLRPARMTHLSLGLTDWNHWKSEPIQLILQLGIPVDLLVSLFKLKADMLASHILTIDQQASEVAGAAAAAQKEAAAATALQIVHRLYVGSDREVSELQQQVQDLRINCRTQNVRPHLLLRDSEQPDAERVDVLRSRACGDPDRIDASSESSKHRGNTATATLSTPLQQSLHALLSAWPPAKQGGAAAESGPGALNAAEAHQLEVLPLWQQCMLLVAAQSKFEDQHFKLLHDPGAYMSAAAYSAAAAAGASCSSSSGAVTAVQQLFNGSKPVSSRVFAPASSDGTHPWVQELAAAALEVGDDKLLKGLFSGEAGENVLNVAMPGAPSALVQALLTAHCTPIRNRATAQPMQHQHDMLGLQQWQLDPSSSSGGHSAAGPRFARPAADSALLMLTQTLNDPDLLCKWLSAAIRPAAPQPDLERAKAVLAAVAAAQAMPAGAKICTQEAFRKVLSTGDLDLIAVLMCWLDQLEAQPEPDHEDPIFGDEAAAAEIDALLEAGMVGGLEPAELPWQGIDGEALPVVVPGGDGDLDDDL